LSNTPEYGSYYQHCHASAHILHEVYVETARQVDKWGIQDHPLTTWTHPEVWQATADTAKKDFADKAKYGRNPGWDLIAIEELAEAFAETDLDKVRAELIQVAAVAVSAIENIDRAKAAGAVPGTVDA
jgi:hypothetical protein